MFPYNTNPQPLDMGWTQPNYFYQQNLNQYDSETFLHEVFGLNNQSIEAFKTLSHQLKLKFYLSVQEMKLLGYMNDKVGYQSILSEIARRTVILKKPQKVVDKKKQEDLWGAKLQHLCEDHEKKLLNDNVLNDIQININHTNNFNQKQFNFSNGTKINGKVEDEQQFQWAQPTNEQKKQNNNSSTNNGTQQDKADKTFQSIQHAFSSIPNVQNLFNIDNNTTKQKQELVIKPEEVQNLSFDMLYQNVKHFQKKQEKIAEPLKPIDIWDLEVLQEEPQKKLSLRSLQNSPSRMNKNSSQTDANDLESGLAKYFGLDLIQQSVNQTKNQTNNHNHPNSDPNLNNLQQNIKNVEKQSLTNSGVHSNIQGNITETNPNNNNYNQFGQDKNLAYRKTEIQGQFATYPNTFQEGKKQSNEVQEIKQNNKQVVDQDQDQFQWQQSVQVQAKDDPIIDMTPHSNDPYTNNVVVENQITQNKIQTQNEKNIPNSNNFSFDFLESSQDYKSLPEINPYAESNPFFMSTTQYPTKKQSTFGNSSFDFGLENNGGIDFSSFEDISSISSISKNQEESSMTCSQDYAQQILQNNITDNNLFKKKKNQDQEDYGPIPSAIYPNIDTSIIQSLKRKPETNTINRALKKKIFDFDRNFYQQALNLIVELGYEENPDYSYMKQQSHICQQIFRLTEAYSAAVDQQQEQQIIVNFKKCKNLYAKLDTDQTANIARKYLKLQGKTFSYQIGRLSLEAGVPKQLIQKAIKSSQFNQIATLLFLMVYFGSTYSINLFTSQVIQYINHIYSEMEALGKQVSQSTSQCKIIVKKNQKFIQYRENLNLIGTLAKRLLLVGRHCLREQQTNDIENIETVSQRVQSMINKSYNSTQQIIPNEFLAFFADFACNKSNNIYTLHSKMAEFIQQHPLCCLCLQTVNSEKKDKRGQKGQDNKYYHFKCYNFKSKVTQYINKQIQEANYKQEEEQGQQ